ncbi:MAG TPA: hypothetical protein DC001_04155, partial [Clostridiales bacterium]|nr:hypothetical protein [Clostridiales bacterium]
MQLFGGKRNGRHVSGAAKHDSGHGTINSDQDTQYGKDPGVSPEEYTAEAEKRGTRRWMRRTLTALGVIALILAGAYVAFQIWVTPPEININTPANPGSTNSPGDGTEGTPKPEDTEQPIDAEAPVQAVTSGRRDGTYTFAIVGTDVISGSTDTILVGMLDTVDGKLNLVSIPRDTLVNTAYDVKKIN